MSENRLAIYIDLSLWLSSRINTGIQRVLKEFVQRSLQVNDPAIDFYYLDFDLVTKKFLRISAAEIQAFLQDIPNYEFIASEEFELLEEEPSSHSSSIAIFFDMDAAWNSLTKRMHLYPQLKQKNYYIFNFLYDLSPLLLPQFSDENTCRNYATFLTAVYAYSDMVFFDSASAEKGFLAIKQQIEAKREIPTRVTGLGADYMQQLKSAAPALLQQELLGKKYLLFVGTIEPRKSQNTALDAFTILAKKYPDLNLVFIGKQGWKVAKLIKKIESSPLKDKQVFWLDTIDDNTLSLFYQHAWMVIYLSKHEGYGLPIAESLLYNNITIASKNSSMYEVGKNFADYVVYNSHNEIIDLVSLYYENQALYQLKKQYIKDNFQSISWDKVGQSVIQILTDFPSTISQTQQHRKTLQFVFISIDIATLQDTLFAIDKYIDFVKEYIVVTSPQHLAAASQLVAQQKVIVIDENKLLGSYANDFNQRDHQKKNWLLRASLLNIEPLDEEFIMLDDDNRPIKSIDLSYFITAEGRYNAYYFYDILNWHHCSSPYDEGQNNLKTILSEKCYELLSYSSHAPQIINKTIFSEAVAEFFEIGLVKAIDEWSVYFNYGVSHYPYLFHKKVFETLNWPASPADWQYQYEPREYSFENYYPAIYTAEKSQLDSNRFFLNDFGLPEKLAIKQEQYQAYAIAKGLFSQYQHYLAYKNKIYGSIHFESPSLSCYLFSIPQRLISISESMFRLVMNSKVINHSGETQQLQLYYLINGHMGHYVEWQVEAEPFSERIIELPISTYGMRRRNSQIQLDLKINQNPLYAKTSPYKIKLTQYKKTTKVRLPRWNNKHDLLDTKKFNLKLFLKENIKEILLLGSLAKQVLEKIRGRIKN